MSRSKARRGRPSDSKTTRLLRAVTLAGIYGGLLLPLVFLPGLVVYPFVFLKLLYFQVLVSLTLPAFLVLAWRDPRYRPRFSWVYAALGGHYVALALSAATAMDRHQAFWGNQERMNGLFSLLHFVAWLAMASSVLKTWPEWRKLLHWQAALGFIMAVVALLQGPFPNLLGFEAGARTAGLLGNPIYQGAYQAFMLFWLALLWVRAEEPLWRRCYAVGIATCASALFASGSRGPLLGTVAGAAIALTIWAISSRRYRLVALEGAALVASMASYFMIAKYLIPLPSLEEFWRRNGALQHIFLADFDPTRRHLWAIAWRAFRDRPWLGWGLTNYDGVFDAYFDPWLMCLGPGATMQDSSHSLYLDHLSTTGAAGFATFLLLWASAFVAIGSALRSGRLELRAGAVLFGMVASYLVQGIFVFDSPGVHSMTHLFLALAVAVGGAEWNASRQPDRPRAAHPMVVRKWSIPLFLSLEVAGSLLALRTSIFPGYASFTTKHAHIAFGRGRCGEALAVLREAARIPTPYLDDQLRTLRMNLSGIAKNGMLDRCPEWRSLLDHGRSLTGTLLEWRPVHCRQRWAWASALAAVGKATQDPAILAEAGRELEAALAENPQRQQLQYSYADWLAFVGRLDEAKAHLDFALSQGETMGESLWRKGIFLWRDLQQGRAGAELIAKAMEGECKYGFKSAAEVQLLAQVYAGLGDRDHLKGVVRYVQDFGKDDRPTLVHLRIAGYLESLGLAAERDRVLEIAQERDSGLSQRLWPWREGRVPLGDIERLYAGSPSPPPSAGARGPQSSAPSPVPPTAGARAPRQVTSEPSVF
jgi:O-antigen ligase